MVKSISIIFASLFFVSCSGGGESTSESAGGGTGGGGSSPTTTFDGNGFGFSFGQVGDPNVELWRFLSPTFETMGSPAIAPDGTVYVANEDKFLYAFNTDGTLKWSFRSQSGDRFENVPSVGSDGSIYISDQGGTLYALNPDGTVKWTYASSRLFDMFNTAIANDGTILITSKTNGLMAFNPDGTIRWTAISGKGITPVVKADGSIYVLSDTALSSFDLATGGLVWEFKPTNSINTVVPTTNVAIGSDGTLFFSDSAGVVYAINTSGIEKWRYNIGSSPRQPPIIGANDTIYIVMSSSNNPTLFSLTKDGALNWSYEGGFSTSMPVIGKTGLIYMGTNPITALNVDGTVNWEVTTFRPQAGNPVIGNNGTLYFPLGATLFALNVKETGLANTAWPMEGQNVRHTGCLLDCK